MAVKKKMWTEESMDNATKDVLEGTLECEACCSTI